MKGKNNKSQFLLICAALIAVFAAIAFDSSGNDDNSNELIQKEIRFALES